MAYTAVWSIFMKKYTKVRRGLVTRALPVTAKEDMEDEYSIGGDSHAESWHTARSECGGYCEPDPAIKELPARNKVKRVKNYLKKCKATATSLIHNSRLQTTTESDDSSAHKIHIPLISHTSWYVNDEFEQSEEPKNHLSVRHLPDEATDAIQEPECKSVASVHVPTIQCDVQSFQVPSSVPPLSVPEDFSDPESIPPYSQETTTKTCSSQTQTSRTKVDLVSLVGRYFGPYYKNYPLTEKILVREARDLLVCTYQGNIQNFEIEFCIPAASLLADVYRRAKVHVGSVVASRGWPLSVGRSGISLHLTELEHSVLRNGDCYLCIKLLESDTKPTLALTWKRDNTVHCNVFRKDYDSPLQIMAAVIGDDISELLKKLLVSVDRAIERVPLESLSFPCPQCLGTPDENLLPKCQCSMVAARAIEKKDSCIQTSPIFELDQRFPHIDSDEDYEYFGRPAAGGSTDVSTQCNRNRSMKGDRTKANSGIHLMEPRCISDLPEKLLMSGITFPGIADKIGRSVIVYDANTIARSEVNETDIARVLTYYSTILRRMERLNNGVSILAVSPDKFEDIHLLDNALMLVSSRIKVDCVLAIWKKTDYHKNRHFQLNKTRKHCLENSKIQFRILTETDSLEEYIDWNQIPSEFGGEGTFDHLEWIQFYKEVEPFLMKCHNCGRRLVNVMSELKSYEDAALNGRQLHQQQRMIARIISDPEMQKLRLDGQTTLAQIEDRAQWLPNNFDVRLMVERSDRLFAEVERAAKRLEQLLEKRREKLKELLRIKALEDETTQVISWLTQSGEDELKQHSDLANNLPDIKQQEQDFEKFYFISMRNLDKAGDLLEEAGQCSGGASLKDLAKSLKLHLRGFSDRLEDTRERLEDTSRCFYLLDQAYEWALDAMKYMSRVKPEDIQNPGQSVKQLKQYLMAHPALATEHFAEMLQLAQKLNNEKLLEQCRVAQSRCEETLENIRSLVGTEVPNWVATSTPVTRRRSLPCHHHQQQHHSQGQHQQQQPHAPAAVDTAVIHPASYTFWDSAAPLDNIQEECFCHSNRTVNVLQRSCTWQYQTENYDDDDKLSSSADNTTEGSEAGTKSSDDVEDVSDASCAHGNAGASVVPVNTHLYRNDSLHLNTNCGPQTLKKQKTAKLIMREMVQTERDYVKALEYVIENYIPELIREDIPQALRGQRNVIFGNIEKIYEFHSQNFLHELEKCEYEPFSVGQSFLKHEKRFYLYALYNKNKPKSDSLMSEYGTAFFKTKQLKLGDKMDLASYLLKPVQRMGKYALLLQQLMKVAKVDISELRDAEEMVRFQLRHGNDLLAMDSLKDCDVNLKEQGRLLRQNEFLVWQGKGKKCLRHVFLFEELILFSKARRFPDSKNLDLYIYKNSIKTSDIGLTAKVGDSNTKFEIWYRKRKPNDTFTLQSMSEDIKRAWTEELSNLLWKQALKNREMRIAEMSSMGIGNKPCLDIRPSADQISDRSISIDQLCKTAPRFRNSIAVSTMDAVRNKRPHSVISVSSSSSSGGSSSSNCENRQTTSHCSSAESGIVTDWNTNTLSTNSSIMSEANSPSRHLSVKLDSI